MASKTNNNSAMAIFLALNLLFFSTVSATCGGGCGPSTPKPNPIPTPTTPTTPSTGGSGGNCPIDALRLGVCADVLSSLLNANLGSRPPLQPCCSLINGLVDLDAAVCLCTAIKANVLGINLNVPLCLGLLLNACQQKVPSGFQCS